MRKPSNTISTRSPTLRAVRAAQPERALHVPCPIRVARRIVEERVPAAPALSRLALIERTGAADDGLAVGPDGGDERLRGIERERRAPDPCRLVRPRDGHRVVAASDGDGAGPHAGEIERHRHRRAPARERAPAGQGRRHACQGTPFATGSRRAARPGRLSSSVDPAGSQLTAQLFWIGADEIAWVRPSAVGSHRPVTA